jgi:hypothetical protein
MTNRHVRGGTPPGYSIPEEVRRIALLILEDYKKSRENTVKFKKPAPVRRRAG